MIVQRLRLERGWSQQQMADISGVAVRTIQRIEGGQPASIDTVKALAAAFGMEFNALREEIMQGSVAAPAEIEIERAFEHARNLRGFYAHVARYGAIVGLLVASWAAQDFHLPWIVIPVACVSVMLFVRWVQIFQLDGWFGPAWERKVVERRLGRKIESVQTKNDKNGT